MMETVEHKRHEMHYQGRVQGVGFRYTVRQIAASFAVTGYVRNLPDGRVQLVVEGQGREIQRFLAEVQSHLGRHIADTQATVSPASAAFLGFEIRF